MSTLKITSSIHIENFKNEISNIPLNLPITLPLRASLMRYPSSFDAFEYLFTNSTRKWSITFWAGDDKITTEDNTKIEEFTTKFKAYLSKIYYDL